MIFPTARRTWNGVDIEGQHIVLRLQPSDDGTIGVSIAGLPALTGFDSPCRLSDDNSRHFPPAGITVHDTRLECFAANQFAPMLREGFTLELEPGMAPLLRTWLDKLAAVAATAKAIADKFSAQLAPPIHHMLDAITSVVARIVLDGWDVEHSVAYERAHGICGREQAFMDQFDTEGVQQQLAQRSGASPTGTTSTGA
jgi:hypothetical protein